jgi:hypothetical protein
MLALKYNLGGLLIGFVKDWKADVTLKIKNLKKRF